MIPKNAKRVFKGILFDVYHWRQKLLDGSYGTFEGIKRRASVQVIATTGGRVILFRETQPFTGAFTGLPGGVVGDGEDKRKTVLRELKEESGMVPESIELWRRAEFSTKIEWPTYYYIARNCRKVSAQKLDRGGEEIRVMLVPFGRFVELSSRPDFRNREFSNYMFRLRQEPKKLEAFRKKVFGTRK
jgi:ADP-ribose pyrophosphatase YjhB (NUDIX family)